MILLQETLRSVHTIVTALVSGISCDGHFCKEKIKHGT